MAINDIVKTKITNGSLIVFFQVVAQAANTTQQRETDRVTVKKGGLREEKHSC